MSYLSRKHTTRLYCIQLLGRCKILLRWDRSWSISWSVHACCWNNWAPLFKQCTEHYKVELFADSLIFYERLKRKCWPSVVSIYCVFFFLSLNIIRALPSWVKPDFCPIFALHTDFFKSRAEPDFNPKMHLQANILFKYTKLQTEQENYQISCACCRGIFSVKCLERRLEVSSQNTGIDRTSYWRHSCQVLPTLTTSCPLGCCAFNMVAVMQNEFFSQCTKAGSSCLDAEVACQKW